MASTAQLIGVLDQKPPVDEKSAIGAVIERWIYFGMSVWFAAIVLAGFVPDSLDKIAAVEAGQRPPFPLILHAHAVLMGSFLALLMAQTGLAATGNLRSHRRLGMVAFLLVPAMIAVGLILVPTQFQEVYHNWQAAVGSERAKLSATLARRENILLIQLRTAILFPLFMTIALAARQRDGGLHKRMMILATSTVLMAGINRITWLPTTFPKNLHAPESYVLLAIAPMFIWDVVRQGKVHRAYLVWAAFALPSAVVVNYLWDNPGWHVVARQLLTT